MEIDNTKKIMRIVIGFFLLLNVLSLSFGYYIIDSKFKDVNNNIDSQYLYVSSKKESILEEINVISKSKEDLYANILTLKDNITLLKTKINQSTQEFESVDAQNSFYLSKLDTLQNANLQLRNQKLTFQKQLQTKQQIALQQQASQQAQLKAKTTTTAKKTVTTPTPVVKKAVATTTTRAS